MKKIKLSNRLASVASMITPDAGVIDVGTDHGYLPVYLAQTGIARRIVASDVNIGPLRRAMTTADGFGVAEEIEFVHTDGLHGIEHTGIDTVVIAGMGGETMIAILEPAQWVRAAGVRLILQPQSKLPELTGWLETHGFAVLDAALPEDDGKIYMVLCAQGDGSAARLGTEKPSPYAVLLNKRDGLLPKYLDREIGKARHVIAGLEKAADGQSALPAASRHLARLLYLKEETEQWLR